MNFKRTSQGSFFAAAGLFMVLSAPLLLPVDFPLVGIDQAVAAGNGNGNGNGNGKGSAKENNGNGNSNRQSAGSTSNRGNGGNANASENANAGGGNLHAELGGLNSLNRNVNGLMNSNDPRMTAVREFVQAGADLVDAQDALVTAQTNFDTTQNTYNALITSLGVAPYENVSPDGLQSELDAVNSALLADPANADLLTAQATLENALLTINSGTEWNDLTTAYGELTNANQTVSTLETATSDDTLLAALQDAANPNRTVGSEELDWAKMQLEATLADYLATE